MTELGETKQIIMERFGVSEPVVHYMLMKAAMDCRAPVEDICRIWRMGLEAERYLLEGVK